MSAFGGKADINHYGSEGPLIAISGHLRIGKSMLEVIEERQTSRSGRRLRAALYVC